MAGRGGGPTRWRTPTVHAGDGRHDVRTDEATVVAFELAPLLPVVDTCGTTELHYSQAIWRSLDPATITLAPGSRSRTADRPLMECDRPDPGGGGRQLPGVPHATADDPAWDEVGSTTSSCGSAAAPRTSRAAADRRRVRRGGARPLQLGREARHHAVLELAGLADPDSARRRSPPIQAGSRATAEDLEPGQLRPPVVKISTRRRCPTRRASPPCSPRSRTATCSAT